MGFGKILREPVLKSIHIFWLASLNLWKRLTYTRIYLKWFSQLYKKKMRQLSKTYWPRTRIFKCYKKSDLEEIHIKLHNQWNQPCCGESIFVKVLFLKAEELKYFLSYRSLLRYKRWLVRNFWEFVACQLVTFQSEIVEREKGVKKVLTLFPWVKA